MPNCYNVTRQITTEKKSYIFLFSRRLKEELNSPQNDITPDNNKTTPEVKEEDIKNEDKKSYEMKSELDTTTSEVSEVKSESKVENGESEPDRSEVQNGNKEQCNDKSPEIQVLPEDDENETEGSSSVAEKIVDANNDDGILP